MQDFQLNKSAIRICRNFQLRRISDLGIEDQQELKSLTNIEYYAGCLIFLGEKGDRVHKLLNSTAFSFLERIANNTLSASEMDESRSSFRNILNRLIYDGILEIKKNNIYETGPCAVQFSISPIIDQMSESGRLSHNAIIWALRNYQADANTLTGKLYSYNSLALTPSLSKIYIGNSDGGRERIGLHKIDLCQNFSSVWEPLTNPHVPGFNETWSSWYRREPEFCSEQREFEYKLYFGVPFHSIRPLVTDIVQCISRSQARSFKVGRRISDVLRPDYFIVYFDDLEALSKAAVELSEIVKNCPVQGVPFTRRFSGSGSLSWAIDKLYSEERINPATASWRRLVCQKLANAIKQIHNEKAGDLRDAAIYVKQRLEMDGIDTKNWCYR